MAEGIARKGISIGIMANTLEWVDYALYGAFSAVMAPLFFPSSDAFASQLAVFGVFALGFVARPVGGAIFGHIGDRVGRRNALFFSIALMAIPTAFIGLLPTYAQIGAWAPALLTGIRILQGLAIGGEHAGAMVSLVENAPPGKRGQLGSWAEIGCLLGTLVGGQLCSAALSAILSTEAYTTWGWRVPFLLSICLVYVGFQLKKHLEESPSKKRSIHMPIVEVLKKHKKPALWTMFITFFSGISFYSLLVFLPNYIVLSGKGSVSCAFFITAMTNACMVPTTFFAGWVTDYFRQRKRFLQISVVGVLCAVCPMAVALHTNHLFVYGIFHLMSGIFLSFYYGGRAAFFAETFPAHVRYTAVSCALGLGQAIAGGTAPFISTYLVELSGDIRIIILQFAFGAAFALYAFSKVQDRTALPFQE
ncbi:MAG: MFS transporter [Holosporales bacterium]|jgi:MHS family proline/betaine transporter-like MFS transporter|nr:MFS transporter [Holosporales bacterium]